MEQRQRSGNEELHTLRQIRVRIELNSFLIVLLGRSKYVSNFHCGLLVLQVEFERVRLMCERICRRERLKVLFFSRSVQVGAGNLHILRAL